MTQTKGLSDADLIREYNATRAPQMLYTLIFQRHYAALRRVAGSVMPHPFDTAQLENIITDFYGFLTTDNADGLSRLHAYDGKSDAKPYLAQMLRNYIFDLARQQQKQQSTHVSLDSGTGKADSDAALQVASNEDDDEELSKMKYTALLLVLENTQGVSERDMYIWLTHQLGNAIKDEAGRSGIYGKLAQQLGLNTDAVKKASSRASANLAAQAKKILAELVTI